MPVEYRLIKCMEKFPIIWNVHEPGKEVQTVNYYKLILKKKYLKLLKWKTKTDSI